MYRNGPEVTQNEITFFVFVHPIQEKNSKTKVPRVEVGVARDGFEVSPSKRRHGQVTNNCKTKVPKVGVGIG